MFQVWVGENFDKEKIEKDLEFDTRFVYFIDDLDFGSLAENFSNNGLFAEKKLFVFYDFFSNEQSIGWLKEKIDTIDQSFTKLLFYEEKIKAPVKNKLEKLGADIKKVAKKEEFKKKDNQVFAITDAILQKDRKGAWVNYQKALRSGKAPEEIMGLIWWQVKSLWLVARMDKDSGLKPFVYQKNKRALAKYNQMQIYKLAKNIVRTYHQARMGELPLEYGCEKLLLSI